MRARLTGLDDDVAGYHLDVLVTQRAQHGEAGIICDAKGAIREVRSHVVSDVRHRAYVFQEAAMRSGHIGAHVLDEALLGSGRALALALGAAAVGFDLAGGAVLDAKDDVEELD